MSSDEESSDGRGFEFRHVLFKKTRFQVDESDSSLDESEFNDKKHKRCGRVNARWQSKNPLKYPNYQKEVQFISAGITHVTFPEKESAGCKVESGWNGSKRSFLDPDSNTNGVPVSQDTDVFFLSTSSFDSDSPEEGIQRKSSSRDQNHSLVPDYSLSSSCTEEDQDDRQHLASDHDDDVYAFEQKAREKKKQSLQQKSQKPTPKSHAHHHGEALGHQSMLRLYGKGFKLLKQMGYKGGGLGKAGTGIITPLVSQTPGHGKRTQIKEGRQSPAFGHRTFYQKSEELQDSDPALDHLDAYLERSKRKNFVSVTGDERIEDVPFCSSSRHNTTPREKHHFKTAAEIAQEAESQYAPDVSHDPQSTASLQVDHGDALSLYDLKHLDDASSRQKIKRQQECAAQGNSSETVPSLSLPFRVIDMAEPQQRVIEDIFEFRNHMTTKSTQERATLRRQQRKADRAHSGAGPESSLQQLCDDIYSHIEEIQENIYLVTRNRIAAERKLKNAVDEEQYYIKKKIDVEKELWAVKTLLKCSTQLRHSEELKWVESQLTGRHETPDYSTKKTQDQLRKEAQLKYSLSYTPSSTTSQHRPTDIPPKEAHEASQETSTPENASLMVLKHDKESLKLKMIDLFKKIILTFLTLCRDIPREYHNANIFLTATQFVGVLHRFLSFESSSAGRLLDPKDLCLVPYLVDFRSECIPETMQELRYLWQEIITQDVIRGLTAILAELQINPAKQDLKPLEYFFEWINVVSLETITNILETELFPKWLDVLCYWLNSPGVNLEEVYIWYNGWKSIFPDILSKTSSVQKCFMRGLELINTHLGSLSQQPLDVPPVPSSSNSASSKPSTSGSLLEPHSQERLDPGEASNPRGIDSADASRMAKQKQEPLYGERERINIHSGDSVIPPYTPSPLLSSSFANGVKVASSASRFMSASSLTEILEALAEEHDILFVPKRGRFYNGRQVFSFGTASIYMDSGIIYQLNTSCGSWLSIPLSRLLDQVKTSL